MPPAAGASTSRLAIRPYPLRYVAPWTMKDGTDVVIRPISAEDEMLMRAFHESLSDKTVYMRYLSPMLLSTRITHERLARLLTPVGYFNVKATRLKNFCQWYLAHGGQRQLQKIPTETLRHLLLEVNGIGPETADDMLLYAFGRPVFVIDAYTRRLFVRLGIIEGRESYETLRSLFETKLARVKEKVTLFNEYHALIVHHAKYICRNKPLCHECCLCQRCKSALL